MPPAPREWLPEGDLVYFILDVVKTLDWSEITARYEKEDRGFPPYHPRRMVALLLYSYGMGVYSSRRIQKLCERNAAYRAIVGNDVPNFGTIRDFRKDPRSALQGLFVQVLKPCREAGLVKVGLVSLDGTQVEANASRHKAMSYEDLPKEEERLQKEIAEDADSDGLIQAASCP
ncbi:MAG: transposase [Thermoplasmata archaeon]